MTAKYHEYQLYGHFVYNKDGEVGMFVKLPENAVPLNLEKDNPCGEKILWVLVPTGIVEDHDS